MSPVGTPLIDYYQVLGVRRDADDATIREAQRARLRESHPDLNDGMSAVRLMLINEAFEVLSDTDRRRQHDLFLDSLHIPEVRERRRRWWPWLLLLLLLLLGLGWQFGPRTVGQERWFFFWPAPIGSTGPSGAAGADGLNGTDGLSGVDGRDGSDGAAGLDGVDGSDGADGLDGVDGSDGADGADGADGLPGPTGPASGVIDFGQGALTAVGCDSEVKLAMSSFYNGSDFFLDRVEVSRLSSACNGKTLRVFLLTAGSRSNLYGGGDIVVCEREMSSLAGDANIVAFTRTSPCKMQATGQQLQLQSVYSRDISDAVGGVAIEIV